MNSNLLLAATGAAIGAATVAINKLRRQPPAVQHGVVAELRQRLAEALDDLQAARDATHALRVTIAEYGNAITERDATITGLMDDHERSRLAISNLLMALNAANVRCAELQTALNRCGGESQSAYFMAIRRRQRRRSVQQELTRW